MGEETIFFPGFRFYPTDDELVGFYLHHKLANPADDRFLHVIPVVNIFEFDPYLLPERAGMSNSGDSEWYFFCPRQEREAQGGRPNRLTPSGYWKATGSPSFVFSNNRKIGRKKTLVFYEGRAPTGTKTPWKMNEFSLLPHDQLPTSSHHHSLESRRDEFTVCRVYTSSGHARAFDRRPSINNMACGSV